MNEGFRTFKQYNLAKLQTLAAVDYITNSDASIFARRANSITVGLLLQVPLIRSGNFLNRIYSYFSIKVVRPVKDNDGTGNIFFLSKKGERVLNRLLDNYYQGIDLHLNRTEHEKIDYTDQPLLPGLEDAHKELLQALYSVWWLTDGPSHTPDTIANAYRVRQLLGLTKTARARYILLRYEAHFDFFKDKAERDGCREHVKLSPRGREMLDLMLERLQAGQILNPLKRPVPVDYTGFKLLPGRAKIENELNGITGESYPGITDRQLPATKVTGM